VQLTDAVAGGAEVVTHGGAGGGGVAGLDRGDQVFVLVGGGDAEGPAVAEAEQVQVGVGAGQAGADGLLPARSRIRSCRRASCELNRR
jgi:hypothetical protein